MLGLERKHAWEVFIIARQCFEDGFIDERSEGICWSYRKCLRAQGTKLGHTQLDLVELSATLVDLLVQVLMKTPALVQSFRREGSKYIPICKGEGSRIITKGSNTRKREF